ncbi:MAG: hypothetical protein Q9160_000726 [Pyrenula sp. 1 TL-2023]
MSVNLLGLRTLEKLGIDNALDDEVAFRGPSGIPMIFRHWKTNEIASTDHFTNVPVHRHQTARFHRAHLHQSLLQHIPEELIHLKKKLTGVEADVDGVTAHFANGTKARGDVLIGADGIHSKVRKAFVPDHRLKWTGNTFMRATFDASLVSHIPDLPPDSTHWWGLNHSFFASRLGHNQYTVVGRYDPAAAHDSHAKDPKDVAWDDEGNVDLLRSIYKDWNPVVKALTEATPYVRLFPNYAGDALKSWVFSSRVTLVGDAAHTHGGAYAAGGSLALDDAYALLLSFLHVLPFSKGDKLSASEVEQALRLYEGTRQKHTERLLNGVHAARGLRSPRNDEELRQKLLSRADTTWLTEHDVETAFAKVVEAHGSQPIHD